MNAILYALGGTGFTFLMTSLGAAVVFLFRKQMAGQMQRVFLGFASGVMIAASVWSLLIPAIEEATKQGKIGWIPSGGGFLLGGAFFLLLDTILPHLHPESGRKEGADWKLSNNMMMMSAVTLHNIPEGMAVGLAFALALMPENTEVTLASAMALALGIGIQNFPEGAAIALPLKKDGMSNKKAFFYGMMSGVVEPIAGVFAVLIAGFAAQIMPWLLSFAAGAMVYVVADELIPEAHEEHSNLGTVGVMVGFVAMMILDVALG